VTSRNKKIYTRASDVPSSWYDKEGYLKKRYRHRVRLNPQGTTSRKRVANGKRGRQRKTTSGFPTDRWVNVEKVKVSRNGRLKQVVIRDSQMPGSLKKALSKKTK